MSIKVTEDHMDLDDAITRLSDKKAPKRDDMASINNSSSLSWDLNTDFNTARDLASSGWSEKADKLKQYMATIERLVDSSWETSWDVAGEVVDVGRFLGGEPECMLSFHAPKINHVEVIVNISARCSADAELLLNRGIGIAAAVYAMQASGVEVSLKVGEWVKGSGDRIHETLIEINKFGQYIDPGRLAFWLGHPAALRRCIFRYNEQQKKKTREKFGFQEYGGYGSPRDAPKDRVNREDAIYIEFPETDTLYEYSDPEKAYQKVKEIFTSEGLNLSAKE